jgi:hypothetical protein
MLLKLADKYCIQILRTHCENFIQESFIRMGVTDRKLIQILQSAVDFHLSNQSLSLILSRVIEFDMNKLKAAKLAETLPSKIVSALLISKYEHDTSKFKSYQHSFDKKPDGSYISVARACSVSSCMNPFGMPGAPYTFAAMQCTKCDYVFCFRHRMYTGCLSPCIGPDSAVGSVSMPTKAKFDMSLLD